MIPAAGFPLGYLRFLFPEDFLRRAISAAERATRAAEKKSNPSVARLPAWLSPVFGMLDSPPSIDPCGVSPSPILSAGFPDVPGLPGALLRSFVNDAVCKVSAEMVPAAPVLVEVYPAPV